MAEGGAAAPVTILLVEDDEVIRRAVTMALERYGYREETYYTFSYSPVPNDEGGTGGIFCANTDDTERIVGERQIVLLRELASRTADARAVQAVQGKGDMVDVVTAVSESQVALETLVSVRDRVISAYEDILRMQI